MMDMSGLGRVGVVVASLGRPEALATLVAQLMRQTLRPEQIVLSVVDRADAPSDETLSSIADGVAIEVVTGSKGLCAQRNRGMARLSPRCDWLVFFDDDFVPSRFALEGMASCFRANPDVAGITGVVLADGITGPGVKGSDAERMVAEHDAGRTGPDSGVLAERASLYGCNMAYRCAMLDGMRFDERLPLYGWQEDVDFSMRVRARGRMVVAAGFVGVHCGVKAGREKRGQRLGYSQIANPVYLVRKGVMPRREAARLCLRNVLANHGKLLTPEPWVDRRGRAAGNWMALRDWAAGRLDPERILAL